MLLSSNWTVNQRSWNTAIISHEDSCNAIQMVWRGNMIFTCTHAYFLELFRICKQFINAISGRKYMYTFEEIVK